MNNNVIINQLNKHVSVRTYSEKTIEADLLNELMSAACRASTTGNMQLYSIVVTSDQRLKEELSPCHFNQPMVKQAPLVITFCADYNRYNRWCELNKADAGCGNFQAFMTAAIDALLVAQNFCIAAEAHGLGICYLGTTTYNAARISEVLALPEYVVPVTTLTVGYPLNLPELTDRLPLESVVHYDTYREDDDETIQEYYSAKEALESSKTFVKENNKENLAQVYAEVRYTRANFEHFSRAYTDLLKKQGFVL